MEGALPDGPPGSRTGLVNTLFGELQQGFERALRQGVEGKAEGESPDAPRLSVSKARPRPDGVEFILESPAGSFRFLNSLDGVIRVFREESGRFREARLVTIGLEGGRPRMIERTAGVPRAPFRVTSVPQIVKEFGPAAQPR
jgi:hypothetical protein